MVRDFADEDFIDFQETRSFVNLQVEEQGMVRPRWTTIELVLLEGVIVNIYQVRHSLKPTKKAGGGNKVKTWNEIHQVLKRTKERLFELTNLRLPIRSLSAIQKRWKNFDRKSELTNYDVVPLTKARLRYFEQQLNLRNVFLCSDQAYYEIRDIVRQSVLCATHDGEALNRLSE